MNRLNAIFIALLVLMVVARSTVDVQAGTGTVLTLPRAGSKTTSGLLLQIDTRWLDGNGYRPVRVRISPIPPGPAPADRRVRVTIRPRGWRTNTRRNTVTGTVELAQGAAFAQETISIPHHEGWSSLEVEVREDGALLKDLSTRHLGIPRRNYYEWTEASPSVLFIDSDMPAWPPNAGQRNLPKVADDQVAPNRLPDLRGLASRLPMLAWQGAAESSLDLSKTIDDAEVLRLLRELPRFEIVSPVDLPNRWLDLTCVDIAVISRSDLELLARSYPERWEALRAWAAAGTVLCVTGLDLVPEELTALEELAGASPHAADGDTSGWSTPSQRDYSPNIFALESYAPSLPRPLRVTAQVVPNTTSEPEKPVAEPPRPRPFRWRSLGSGFLVAIGDEKAFFGQPESWSWLFNSLSERHWMWYQRHGFSMYRENPDYWKLLIPGVGEAPVNSFLLLISLFVIVIGPVNYFVLQRSGRLYLLLVTVPAGAFFITCGLFAYALVTDGLAVRARVRSVTEIDQPSSRAVAWSRQTYYAGIAPAGGIAYPEDAAVYPVEFRPQSRFIPTDRRWHTVWDGQQSLIAGYLPSRTTTQFLVVESRRTAARLDLQTAPHHSLKVTNQLGTRVSQLLVRDADGDYYAGQNLAAGASATLPRVEPQNVATVWNRLFARHLPRYPEGFDPYQMENAAQIFPNMSYHWSNIDGSLAKPTFDNSVFESRLQSAMRRDFRNMPVRSYLAIVDSSPEVHLGTDRAQQQASLHAVLGRW